MKSPRITLGKRLLTACAVMVLWVLVPEATADEFKLTTSVASAAHGPERAFDGSVSPDSFWEVVGNYPFWLQMEYVAERTVSKYTLQAGELTERMPTDWRLEGSQDGNQWTVLDSRTEQKAWRRDQPQYYAVSKPGSYRFYRFCFNAGLDPKTLRIYEISFDKPGLSDFVLGTDGSLEWPGRLRIRRSGDQGLPDLEDGRKRARSGGALEIQPQGDFRRGAIDLIPTPGKRPDVDALGEVTLHRLVPSPEGCEMVSFSALATESIPFGIIVESTGKGRPRPFLFWTLRENTAFTEVTFAESFRITEDGALQVGRKRGKGSAVRLLQDDPALNDQTSTDALFLEKQDPPNEGSFNSDYFTIVGKSRHKGTVVCHQWRMNVQVEPSGGGSSLVIHSGRGDSGCQQKLIVTSRGDVELSGTGGLIMRSPNGKRWRVTVDNSGKLKAGPME